MAVNPLATCGEPPYGDCMEKKEKRDQRLYVYLSKSEMDELADMANRLQIPLAIIARATLLEAARKQIAGAA